ncbi:hypothetical protein ANN_14858 [Periplaneta americana]|uniref:Per a allergen n=1 Tax=Periplaneta americana TaxID=6978 RepID=A0ABQ8SYJ5_PERAM|nr:hypothetical protein ANN_14858 [Periplaneta americana]
MLAGNEFQSLGRAIVKEDEYEEVRWDGIVRFNNNSGISRTTPRGGQHSSTPFFPVGSTVLTRYDPCDYDLFTKMKEPLRGTRYNTRDELIRALGRSIRNINKDDALMVYDAFQTFGKCSDITDTAKLDIFIRGVDEEINIMLRSKSGVKRPPIDPDALKKAVEAVIAPPGNEILIREACSGL